MPYTFEGLVVVETQARCFAEHFRIEVPVLGERDAQLDVFGTAVSSPAPVHRLRQLLGGLAFSTRELGVGFAKLAKGLCVGQNSDGLLEGLKVGDGEGRPWTVTVTRSCCLWTRPTSSDRWAFTSAKGNVSVMVTSLTMLQAIR